MPTGFSSVRQATGSRMYSAYAQAAPGANTNIIATGHQIASVAGLRFARKASRVRVFVVLTTGSVFNYTVTNGTTAYTNGLNASAALNAGDAYEFEFSVEATDDGTETGNALTYNFQVETDSVIRQLIVTEITGPA